MIILFGPAGSGKSTQGRIIAEKYGWVWLSVGQVLRDTGMFRETLKQGGLVDDNEVIRLMNREMEKADANGAEAVLDGYPRDITQAKWMAENGVLRKISLAIVLEVPVEELFQRIEKRGREDDTKEVVERRFRVFHENIDGILPILRENDVKVVRVDGVGEFEEITERIQEVLKEELGEEPVVFEAGQGETEQSYGE